MAPAQHFVDLFEPGVVGTVEVTVMFNVGAAELLTIFVLVLPVGITVWGLVDASSRPDWTWERVGRRKLLWIFLQALGVAPFLVVGFVSSIVYLSAIRPRLRSPQLSVEQG